MRLTENAKVVLTILFAVAVLVIALPMLPDAAKQSQTVQAQTPEGPKYFGPELKQENVMRDGATMPRITYIYTHDGDGVSVFRDNKTLCEYILSDRYYGTSAPVLVPGTCQKEKKS